MSLVFQYMIESVQKGVRSVHRSLMRFECAYGDQAIRDSDTYVIHEIICTLTYNFTGVSFYILYEEWKCLIDNYSQILNGIATVNAIKLMKSQRWPPFSAAVQRTRVSFVN
jgi:hypothetical protein